MSDDYIEELEFLGIDALDVYLHGTDQYDPSLYDTHEPVNQLNRAGVDDATPVDLMTSMNGQTIFVTELS